MSARIIDPAEVSRRFRDRVRAQAARVAEERGRPLRISGLLTAHDGPARTYVDYAARGAQEVGIDFRTVEITPDQARSALVEANEDPAVDGVFCYYPLVDAAEDRWLRELVDPRKDVEGMHSFWSSMLYENRRTLPSGHRSILPCTPLAILKLLDEAGIRHRDSAPDEAPLRGVRICVINRSDLVGRPLSAMLANDGAEVVSLDLSGVVEFDPAIGRHTHSVRDSALGRAEALGDADVVVTGVPSRDFRLVEASEIKPGAICVNFSQYRNFDESVLEVASTFVPRVGPMTVTMAMRNLVRLAALKG